MTDPSKTAFLYCDYWTCTVLCGFFFFHWRSLSNVVPEGVGSVFEQSAKEGKASRFLREIKAI